MNNLPTGKTRFLERSEYVHLREFLDAERDAEKLKKTQDQARELQIKEAAKDKAKVEAKSKKREGRKKD